MGQSDMLWGGATRQAFSHEDGTINQNRHLLQVRLFIHSHQGVPAECHSAVYGGVAPLRFWEASLSCLVPYTALQVCCESGIRGVYGDTESNHLATANYSA